MRRYMSDEDQVRNTLARAAAKARAERFENTPAIGLDQLGIEPLSHDESIEIRLARLNLVNQTIAAGLKEMTS